MNPAAVFLSCEHASNRVPSHLIEELRIPTGILASHRGWDPGSSELAQAFATALGQQHVLEGDWSRLVIELNRSPGHHALFSTWSRRLPASTRRDLLRTIHTPHWKAAEQEARKRLRRHGTVLHLGIHTFTPYWKGQRRTTRIGVLYDPARKHEQQTADRLVNAFQQAFPRLAVHRNRPYRGTSDGLVTSLRKNLGPRYLGIELEFANDLARRPGFAQTAAQALKGFVEQAFTP